MKYATAYITRDGVEYEVSAKLYEHGEADEGVDDLGGMWMELVEDPVFIEFYGEDDDGVELVLTPKEMFNIEEQMIDQYWEAYKDGEFND